MTETSVPCLLIGFLLVCAQLVGTALAVPPPTGDAIATHLRSIGHHLNPEFASLDYAYLFRDDLTAAQVQAVRQASRSGTVHEPAGDGHKNTHKNHLHARGDDADAIASMEGVHGRRPTPKGFMTISAISDFKDISHYGAVAYCAEGANLQGWKCGRKCQVPIIQSSTLHSVINVEGSFAFIALRPSHSQIVVTIRGTKTFENWWDNLAGLARGPLPSYLTNLTHAGNQDAAVHNGFVDSYRPLRAPLQLALRTLLSGANGTDWSIVFTGHSLGGAVATLAALDLAAASDLAIDPARIRLISFGMPRMGNAEFATLVDRVLADRVARVVQENDLVPHLPPMWSGYRHFSGERYVTGEEGARSVKACVGQEDETCSNGRVPWLSMERHGGFLGAKGWFAKQTC